MFTTRHLVGIFLYVSNFTILVLTSGNIHVPCGDLPLVDHAQFVRQVPWQFDLISLIPLRLTPPASASLCPNISKTKQNREENVLMTTIGEDKICI